MRTDALKQYASLRDKLFAEKTKIEARLLAINRVLGQETEQPKGRPVRSARDSATASDLGSGKLTMKEAILKALSKGPMTRKELGKAVEDLGYVSKSKNLLNSMGVFLYSKNSPVKKQGKMFLLPKGAVKESLPKKKRQMSPAARAKIAAAQKARWARQRKAA